MPASTVFQPATDTFGQFTVSHSPARALSPEAEARKAARRHFLIGTGFVAGLIALFGVVSVADRTLFPEPQLTAQEQAYFATAMD